MIAAFIIITLLMTILALVAVLPTFLRSSHEQHDLTHTENLNAARERLQTARSSDMSDDGVCEYEEEIAHQLLQDASEETTPKSPVIGKDWWGVALTTAAVLILTPLLYWQLGTPDTLAPPPSMEALTTKLRQHVTNHPQDAEALTLLGSVMSAQGKYTAAANYYARARVIAGNTPALLAVNINALMMSDAPADDSVLNDLLTEALSTLPNNPSILWLAGLNANRQHRLVDALSYWQQAREKLADTPELQNNIALAIADVEEKLATTTTTTTSGIVVVVQKDNKQQSVQAETLFVFAKTANTDTSMPLAARRFMAPKFPLTVILNDDNTIMPTMKMSAVNRYDIIARLSQSGNAIAQTGDRQGHVSNALAGTTVTVTIDDTISSPAK